MNKRVLISIISIIIIIAGIGVLFLTKEKEVTEEDYKKEPKHILKETVVSEGKYLKLSGVKEIWEYDYQEQSCYTYGTVELTEKGYNDIIDQMDNDLNIDRFEEGEYKDNILESMSWRGDKSRYDTTDYCNCGEHEQPRIKTLDVDEAKVSYVFRVPDCQYQTKWQGKTIMGIFMFKKYTRYYMCFVTRHEYDWFQPIPGRY